MASPGSEHMHMPNKYLANCTERIYVCVCECLSAIFILACALAKITIYPASFVSLRFTTFTLCLFPPCQATAITLIQATYTHTHTCMHEYITFMAITTSTFILHLNKTKSGKTLQREQIGRRT